jgi:Uma2 family endonuclease
VRENFQSQLNRSGLGEDLGGWKRLAFQAGLFQVVVMAVAHPVHRLTEAEYLEIERRAEFKSEFYDGEMFAMAGGSRSHSLIKCNLIIAIGNQLKGCPCRVYDSDMRLKVQANGLYTYPDVSVVCGEDQTEGERDDILLNPTVVVEVLSDSREAYDRGKKFQLYRQLPSLREYLLVNQHQPHVEQFIRQESGEWFLRDVAGWESKLTLPSAGITIDMADVYAAVEFVPEARPHQVPGGRS